MANQGRISFKQSGGVAGLRRECDLTFEELPASARKGMAALIKQGSTSAVSSARDLLTYEIAVSQAGKRKRFRFDEVTLPSSARTLVAYLAAQSRSTA